MKKLEDKIIDKVYVFETKKTLLGTLIKIVSVCLLLAATVSFALVVIKTLSEQETLSVIDIFQENVQAIHTYLLDVIYVIFVETPKLHLLFFVIGLLVLVIILWTVAKNARKIGNKIRSLTIYWSRKKHPLLS
jgi:hypothetical protein